MLINPAMSFKLCDVETSSLRSNSLRGNLTELESVLKDDSGNGDVGVVGRGGRGGGVRPGF